MMAVPIELGGKEFRTKKDLREFLSQEREKTPLGTLVNEQADRVLRDLLSFHPDQDRKVGVGISHFTVRFMPPNTTSFWLHRSDGTMEDFSFHKCIQHVSGVGFREREVKVKLREMIRCSISVFRGNLPEITTCALTGTSLRRGDAAIDHAYPDTFSALVRRFLISERLEWDSFPIEYSGDPKIGRIVSDPGVSSRWHTFHDTKAYLRPVSPMINTKLGDADPATNEDVLRLFIPWVEDNKEFATSAQHREFMLPRIREVLRAHHKALERIHAGHRWMERHPGSASRHLDEWISWITPEREEAA